jgi:hypothetical protein
MSTNFESYKLSEFNSLFEIPIYRVTPDAFDYELQKELDRISNPLTLFENLFPENSKEKYDAHRHELELYIGYLWKFNEIIGWVLLNIDKEIFSADLFYKEGKRIAKGSKSKIIYKGESFRFDILEEMTDLDIYLSILIELKGLTKKSITKGRYIDIIRFETIGKHINWRKMFEELND